MHFALKIQLSTCDILVKKIFRLQKWIKIKRQLSVENCRFIMRNTDNIDFPKETTYIFQKERVLGETIRVSPKLKSLA